MTNLILDIDGTLVQIVPSDDEKSHLPLPRPHLQEFLHFAFANFEHVSIWSAAGEEWVSKILNQVVSPLLPPDQNFHFVWTGKKVTVTQKAGKTILTKQLKKVYKTFPVYTADNTFILDDTPQTYKHNYGNAVGIPSWHGNNTDTTLLTVMENLKKWKNVYQETGTVKHIHKYALPV